MEWLIDIFSVCVYQFVSQESLSLFGHRSEYYEYLWLEMSKDPLEILIVVKICKKRKGYKK